MKRFFVSLLTIFVLLFNFLPSFAETDPIVGVWYIDMELKEGPPVAGAEGYTRFVVVATFEENGNISLFEIDYNGIQLIPTNTGIIGTWEKTGDRYNTKVVGIGEYYALLRDDKDELYAMIVNDGVVYKFHRMKHFQWYGTDIIRSQTNEQRNH